MGVVYLARDERSGREVALKTVLVPRAWMLQGIRREIRSLLRIRHPGVVRVLEDGVHEGVPWYTMELLRGPSLRAYGSGAGDGLGLEKTEADDLTAMVEPSRRRADSDASRVDAPGRTALVLGAIRKLCPTLAFIHGEGIVHRDLKPGNVIVRENGSPVLTDFGLVSMVFERPSRDAIDVGPTAFGTLGYVSPEQAEGGSVDARADLYALGCLIYEAVTGRPPFRATSREELLRLVIGTPPVPPSRLAPDVSPDLDRLVLGLLEKDPRDRIGHASVVEDALGRIGIEGMTPEGPPPRAYLYRPGFVGRHHTLSDLKGRLTRASDGIGHLAVLAGESGVGKTCLARAVAQHAESLGVRVLGGECDPLNASGGAARSTLEPFRPLLEFVADRCRELGAEHARRVLGTGGRWLVAVEPALAGLPGTEGGADDLPPVAARLRQLDALREVLVGLAQERPLLLVLDDIQWADPLTLDFLAFLAKGRHLRKIPTLVLATRRTEDRVPALDALAKLPDVSRFDLDRLGSGAVRDMVADMLAMRPPPDELVGFAERHSEGNPFFVSEYVRLAVEEHLLERDSLGRWSIRNDGYERLGIPRSIQDLVSQRLDGLSPGARTLIAVASAAGREVDWPLLEGAAAIPHTEALEAATELLERSVLDEVEGGGLRFVHDKIREVAYEQLDPESRQRIHGTIARSLDQDAGEERPLAVLAHHWERAGRRVRARDLYLAAARRERDRFSNEEAERLFRCHLALVLEPTPESVGARLEMASSGGPLAVVGRHAEAIVELRQALREVGSERRLEGRALRELADHLRLTGHERESRSLCVQALRIARQESDEALAADVLMSLAVMGSTSGEAIALYEEAAAIYRSRGDSKKEALCLGNTASSVHALGRIDDAADLYDRGLALARSVGARRIECVLLGNYGHLRFDQGRVDEARTMEEEALRLAREVGDRYCESTFLGNVAALLAHAREPAAAAELMAEAAELHMKRGDPSGAVGVRISEALLRVEAGDLPRASLAAHECVTVARQAGGPVLGAALAALAFVVLLSNGDAQPYEEEAAPLLEGPPSAKDVRALCQLGHVALANSRSARPYLERLESAPLDSVVEEVAVLRRANSALESGRPLIHGHCPEDLAGMLRSG